MNTTIVTEIKLNDEWRIRQAIPDDIDFIYGSWLNCYKHASALGKSCRSSIFFDNYKLIVDRILQDKSTTVSVACLPSDEKVILGYIVQTGDSTLHFVYIKEAFRKFGIASTLIVYAFPNNQNPIICSHKTFDSEKYFNKYKEKLEFNPFVLFQKEREISNGFNR